MSWFSSDWGGTAWAEDVTAAATQAGTWLDSTATAKAWPSTHTANVKKFITDAANTATSAADFWTKLFRACDGYGLALGASLKPTNWDKFASMIAEAAGTASTTAGARESATLTGLVSATVDETVGDAQDIAMATGKVVDLFKSPITWVVLGAALLLLTPKIAGSVAGSLK